MVRPWGQVLTEKRAGAGDVEAVCTNRFALKFSSAVLDDHHEPSFDLRSDASETDLDSPVVKGSCVHACGFGS